MARHHTMGGTSKKFPVLSALIVPTLRCRYLGFEKYTNDSKFQKPESSITHEDGDQTDDKNERFEHWMNAQAGDRPLHCAVQ